MNETIIDQIKLVYDNLKPTIGRLACRWMDESKYEDINDYQKVIEKELPMGFTVVKMTKRPFGFHFSVETGEVFSLSMNSRVYRLKRVK
jgi:hypothetical protein